MLANFLFFQAMINSYELESNVEANILGFVVRDKCGICFSFTLLTLFDNEIRVINNAMNVFPLHSQC